MDKRTKHRTQPPLIKWILLNAVGHALGGVPGCALMFCMASVGSVSSSGYLMAAVFGAIIGATVGAMQTIILNDEGIPSFEWTLASALGGALGWILILSFLSILTGSQGGWD